MKETKLGCIEINTPNLKAETFKTMLEWIYAGECELPSLTVDILSLLNLADEYFLEDLRQVSEEQVVTQMDGQDALYILTDTDLVLPESSDFTIRNEAKTVLLEEYEKVEDQVPDIEEKIAKVKGLMSTLLTHKAQKKTRKNRRRNSANSGIDDQNKKRVRFNIPSTIYDDLSSAYHDESDSMMEPLSVISN